MIVVRNERMHFDSKERTSTYYNEICARLNTAILQIQNISDSSQEFKRIQQSFVDALTAQLEHASQEANATLNSTEWDKLVIAFFGETNAGKSTIIETFRILFDETERRKNIHASFFRKLKNAYYELPSEGHSKAYEIFSVCIKLFDVREWFKHEEASIDGLIVGDGMSDFTKIYKEYEMTINGKPFVLIDVPGIEGNEDEYREEIKTALSKAHCVLYVHAQGKNPDSKTAEKIKKYLRDWVKVYSIYNYRSSAGAYKSSESRVTLVNGNVRKVCEDIKSTFIKILGDSYGGNIVIQGLMALSSKAYFSPKRKDLIRRQEALLSLFGSREKLYSFSCFDNVVNLVNEKASNHTEEIFEANKEKLIALSRLTILAIDEKLKEQKKTIERYRNILENYKWEVTDYCNSLLHSIEVQLKEKCDSEFYSLKSILFKIIDDKNSDKEKKKTQMTNCIEKTSMQLRLDIEQIVNENIKELNSRIKDAGKKTKGLPEGLLSFDYKNNENPELNIDIDDILNNIIQFSGFFEVLAYYCCEVAFALLPVVIGSLVGSVVPGVGTIIGALVGGAISVLTADDGKSKAKTEVCNKINETSQKIWNELQKNVITVIKSEANKNVTNVNDEVGNALMNIAKLDNVVNKAKKDILNFESKIKS